MSRVLRPAPPAGVASPRLALASGFLGWMFDAMDLNLFILVMVPALRDLTGATSPAAIARVGGLVVGVKILGWGLGGVAFGVVADRIGRSATLVWTILIYGVFTALGGLALNWPMLALCQFLAGLGIGGEWAAGGALVAETWPDHARARAMQVMQMAYPFGLFLAGGIAMLLGPLGWRYVFIAGIIPVFAAAYMRRNLPEPALWHDARQRAQARAAAGGRADTAAATFAALFAPAMRRNTVVGLVAALALMMGSWGALTLLPGWIGQLLGPAGAARQAATVGWFFVLMNVGTLLGFLALMPLVDRIGRRWSYFLFCAGLLATILYLFRPQTTLPQLERLLPVMGFFFGGSFGTLAVYLPELFPTGIRASGQGFCYNMSRLLTAPGPIIAGLLVGVFGSIPAACAAVALVLVVGTGVIWLGVETKGRPLPAEAD